MDDYSRFMGTIFLKSKSETTNMNDDDDLLEVLKFYNHEASRNED